MILKASQRAGGRALGQHLLNANDNDHVELHEVRGFVSKDLMGAMQEAQALSYGTRCKQYLFSLSLNPPQTENVPIEVFEKTLNEVETRLGLTGHPRAIVFHEKDGRRHAHAVWARIDARTMTAKNLSYFKNTLMEVSRQIYLEQGWKMPRGLMKSEERDPRNFTLDEWQQAKRAGIDPRELKEAVQDAWAVSHNLPTFAKELEARGLFIAKGDRRGVVIVTYEGEVFAASRLIGNREKDVRAKLGDQNSLRSVEETKTYIAEGVAPKLKTYIAEARRIGANQLKPLHDARLSMRHAHRNERRKLEEGQKLRHEAETRDWAARLPTGVKAIWHRVTGEYAKIKAQNEREAYAALQRDRAQRHNLVSAQLGERQALQVEIREVRHRLTRQLLELHKDASRYRDMAPETPQGESSVSTSELGQSFDRAARGDTGRVSERKPVRGEGRAAFERGNDAGLHLG